MVVARNTHGRVQSRHESGVTALRARYRVVRKTAPPTHREETGSTSSPIRSAITNAILSFEASRSEFASRHREAWGSFDLYAALLVLKTTPRPRANRSNEDLSVARKILAAIDFEVLSGTEPTDLSENLDEYIN